ARDRAPPCPAVPAVRPFPRPPMPGCGCVPVPGPDPFPPFITPQAGHDHSAKGLPAELVCGLFRCRSVRGWRLGEIGLPESGGKTDGEPDGEGGAAPGLAPDADVAAEEAGVAAGDAE